MNLIMALIPEIRDEIRSIKTILEVVFSQLVLAPVLLGKDVHTQDGHLMGSVTDLYLDLEERRGQIVMTNGCHLPVDEITEIGGETIIMLQTL